ncbi:MAG TPA: YceI family protein [Nevskia sp.]|nr:YceI family protein [Nevskia sp.]
MGRAGWLLLWLLALDARAAEAYRIEPEQTRVSFDVRRYGVRWIDARFRQVEGSFIVDRAGTGNLIDVSVRTDSLEGLDAGWNRRLRSSEWLDTQRFPQMRFRSTHVEFKQDGSAVAVGQLTLHGVSRPVLLDISRLDCPAPRQSCGFAAHTKIRRSDFDLPHGFWVAGDAVEISIAGVASRRDSRLTAASTLPSSPD